MNQYTHKTPPLADIAIAECQHYLPLVGCVGIVCLGLYVVSGLRLYS